MVTVAAGDDIDDAHYVSLITQLVDEYATVFGQELESARPRDTFVNDFQFERIAYDVARFYYAKAFATYNFGQAYEAIFDATSNFNDGDDVNGSQATPDVFGKEIKHEDINQAQQGITDAKNLATPSYSSLAWTGRWVSQANNVAADDDTAQIRSEIRVDWGWADADGDVTTNSTGSTASYTGQNQNKIKFMQACGGAIYCFGSGPNSSGTDKDEDVKTMLESISYVHYPWPITNIQNTTSWSNATVLQTVNSSNYTGNKLELLVRRETYVLYYALRYTDGSNSPGSGKDHTEAAYDEAVTTDFRLEVRAYYPNHQRNKWIPELTSVSI